MMGGFTRLAHFAFFSAVRTRCMLNTPRLRSSRENANCTQTRKTIDRSSIIPTIGKNILFLVWVVVGVFAAMTLTYYVMFYAFDLPTSPLWATLYTAISYTLACVLIIFLPTRFKKYQVKTSREELGLSGTPKWRDIGLAIVGFVVYFLAAGLLMALFSAIFPWFDETEAQAIGFSALSRAFAKR